MTTEPQVSDSNTAELVTEEMIEEAMCAYYECSAFEGIRGALAAGLRAVAPMIAARVLEIDRLENKAQQVWTYISTDGSVTGGKP